MTKLVRRYDEVVNNKAMARVELVEWFDRKADDWAWVVEYVYTDWYDDAFGGSHEFTEVDEWDFEDYYQAVKKFEQCKDWAKIYRNR